MPSIEFQIGVVTHSVKDLFYWFILMLLTNVDNFIRVQCIVNQSGPDLPSCFETSEVKIE